MACDASAYLFPILLNVTVYVIVNIVIIYNAMYIIIIIFLINDIQNVSNKF